MVQATNRRNQGAGLAEFVIVAGLVAIGSLSVISLFSDNIRGLFSAGDNAISGDEQVLPATITADVDLRKKLATFANQKSSTPTGPPELRMASNQRAMQAAIEKALAWGRANNAVHPAEQLKPNFDPSRIRGMEGYQAVKAGTSSLVIEYGQHGRLQVPVEFQGDNPTSPAAIQATVDALDDTIAKVEQEVDRVDSPTPVWQRDYYYHMYETSDPTAVPEPLRRPWLLALREENKVQKKLDRRQTLREWLPWLMGGEIEEDMELGAELRRVKGKRRLIEDAGKAILPDALEQAALLETLQDSRDYFAVALKYHEDLSREHAIYTGEIEDATETSAFLRLPRQVQFTGWWHGVYDTHAVARPKGLQLYSTDQAKLDVPTDFPRVRLDLDTDALEDYFKGSVLGYKLKHGLAWFVATFLSAAALSREPYSRYWDNLHDEHIRWSDVQAPRFQDVLFWSPINWKESLKNLGYWLTFRRPPDPFEQLAAIANQGPSTAVRQPATPLPAPLPGELLAQTPPATVVTEGEDSAQPGLLARVKQSGVAIIGKIKLHRRINLTGECVDCDLRGLSFSNYRRLHNKNLAGANLAGVSFEGVDLSGSVFDGADLTGANLSETDLSNVSLDQAILDGADLRHARMDGTRLTGARLRGADLRDAALYQTDFGKADLTDANLERIRSANQKCFLGMFSCTEMGAEVDFSQANLTGASLLAAHNLAGSSFDHAILRNTNLRHANLAGEGGEAPATFFNADVENADAFRATRTHQKPGHGF